METYSHCNEEGARKCPFFIAKIHRILMPIRMYYTDAMPVIFRGLCA